MSHRYNTRFQAKNAATKEQSIKEQSDDSRNFIREELLAFTVPFPVKKTEYTGLDSQTGLELLTMRCMLNEIEEDTSSFKRCMVAIRIYHFLEYNHRLFKENEGFRKIVIDKANEFIQEANLKQQLYHSLENTENYYMAVAMNELKISCEKVLTIIKNM